MILKSLSRKGGAGAFSQLYDYISAKAEPERIWHNFLDYQPSREKTIERFIENAQHIKHTPRHNICYHEILSVQRDRSRGKSFEKRQIEALRDITHQYLARRAKDQLAYAAIHLDQAETVHVHMVISANGRESNRRVRLAKQEFLEIQKTLEKRLQERYPELEERTIYNKPWEQSEKLSDREQAMKKRTQAPSKKDLLREELKKAFSIATNKEELKQLLKEQNITLEFRGNNITASHNKFKCRLKTLGVSEQNDELLEREHNPKTQALRELEKFRRRQKKQNESENVMEKG